MLRRSTCIMPLFLLLACLAPEEQARQQAAAAATTQEVADQNRCMIQGFKEGTDAFAQCVRMTIDQQRRPHRCTYCRSVD